MSTIKVTNLKHESSSSDNISLDSSANTTIGGNLIAQAGSASTPAIQATGDANTGIYFSGADAVDVATGGTQALQLDSSQNLKFNSGYGSVATAYGVRAWINFNGNAATIGTGNASANMDAVTDNGDGDYTLNFTNDMPDANYAVTGACSGDTPSDPHDFTGHIGVVHNGFATGSCRIVVTRNQTGGEADIAWNSDKICIAFIR